MFKYIFRVVLIFGIFINLSFFIQAKSESFSSFFETHSSQSIVEEYNLHDKMNDSSPEFSLLTESFDACNLGEFFFDLNEKDLAAKEFRYSIDNFFFSGFSPDNSEILSAGLFELLQRIELYQKDLNIFEEDDTDVHEVGSEESPIDELVRKKWIPATIDPKVEHLIKEDILHQKYDLPVYINKTVITYINYLTSGRKKKALIKGLTRLQKYKKLFRQIFRKEHLPQDLIYMGLVESNFNNRAYSRARAKGIWQFISWTARKYGLRVDWWVDERSDPEKATLAACKYIKDLYQMFGDWYLVLAAYNSGEGRIGRILKRHPDKTYWDMCRRHKLPRETRGYVPAILAAIIVCKNPERFNIKIPKVDPVAYKTVNIPTPTDLRIVADKLGVPLETLRELNPSLRRIITPPGQKVFPLHLPIDTDEDAIAELNNLPYKQRLKWMEHRVRRGDNLWTISRKYGVSISAIKDCNSLRGRAPLLHPGQVLIIPLSNFYKGYRKEYNSNYDRVSWRIRGSSYRVKRGDTLWSISRRSNVSIQTIKVLNNLFSNTLIVGKVLRLRGKVTTIYRRHTATKPFAGLTKKEGIYIVRSGDTLWGISRRFNISLRIIKAINGIRRNSRIKPGQRLIIFRPKLAKNKIKKRKQNSGRNHVIHVVKHGETLYAIAHHYGTDVKSIKIANSLKNNFIKPGLHLVIPN